MTRLERFQNALTTQGERYDAEELETADGCGTRQRDLSRQLTVLVDVLYALVLVGGAEAYRSLFTIGGEFQDPSRFLPVVLALVLIYFTAIHSFIDYHLASEDQPYQFLDKSRRRTDLGRFYLDIVIVGLYSFALLKSHILLACPGGDLAAVFFTFPAIFLLFLVWGALRARTALKGHQPYDPKLLFLCLVLYMLLAIVYVETSNGWAGNSEFLSAALLIMVFYRWMNWRQNRWCADSATNPADAGRASGDLPAKPAAQEEDAA